MKNLAPVITLAVALVWPSVGEAQSKTSTVRSKVAAQQSTPRPQPMAQPMARRSGAHRCAGHAWWGCTGWDPDPNVRAMLGRDIGGDD